MLPKILVVLMLAAPLAPPQRPASGSGAPDMVADPTPFEQFVDKLTLDTDQFKEVQKYFQTAANEAVPVSRELTQLREKMVAAEAAGKADEFAAAAKSYQAASAKMTAIEIKAFKQTEGVLKPKQLSKSAEAFVLIAGMFNQPTPKLRLAQPGR